MTLIAEPPDLAAAAGRHLLRRETAIKGRMPLRRDHRLLSFQIIKSRQDLAVGAVRAIAPLVHTVGDDRTEGMPLSQSHHTRRLEYTLTASGVSAPFFFRFPLFSKLRMQRSEIIESGQDLLSRAERTACV